MKRFIIAFVVLVSILSCSPKYEDLISAINEGDQEKVLTYINRGIDINDKADGVYPILLALTKDEYEVFKILIENGADVNIEWRDIIPLFFAYDNNMYNYIDLMIKNGADINIMSKPGTPLLRVAYERSDFNFASYLINNGAKFNLYLEYKNHNRLLVFDSLESGYEEIITAMVESGNLDFNVTDNKGYSIVHYAVAFSSIDLLKFLIDSNLPINILTDENWSPLVQAIRLEHFDMAKLLLDSGAIIDNYPAPWSTIVRKWDKGASQFAEVYLENGLSKKIETDDPILACIYFANIDAMKWFLEHDFDPNVKDHNGEMPIDQLWRLGFSVGHEIDDYELYKMEKQMFALLLEYGAEL